MGRVASKHKKSEPRTKDSVYNGGRIHEANVDSLMAKSTSNSCGNESRLTALEIHGYRCNGRLTSQIYLRFVLSTALKRLDTHNMPL
jgi:hypothetical protein